MAIFDVSKTYKNSTDDTRLLINLVGTAADQGATLVNYARVVALTKGPDGFIDGVVAADQETGHEWTIAARVVINATARLQTRFAGWPNPMSRRDRAEPGHPSGVRSLVPGSRIGDHGAAHLGRPRHVRHSVAWPHARRHDRCADYHANARAHAVPEEIEFTLETAVSTSSSHPLARTC
jgi:hypothetical protein